jgi:hypothetical protein
MFKNKKQTILNLKKATQKKKTPTHKVLFLSDGRKKIEENHKVKY